MRPLFAFLGLGLVFELPSVFSHCWLGDRKGSWPVKNMLLIPKGLFLKQVQEESAENQ